MNSTAPTYASPARPSLTSSHAAMATSVVPIATAVAIITVMSGTAAPPESGSDVALLAAFGTWNLLPVTSAFILLLWAGRRGWLPYAAAALGNVALGLLTASALHEFSTSASSTAALIFLGLPVTEWLIVAVTGGLAALACWTLSRRRRTR